MIDGLAITAVDAEFLRATMDELPAYVAFVDAELRYVMANQMYCERFGRPEQEIVGRLVREVTGPAFPQVEPYLRGALGGVAQQLEPQMISVEGTRTLRVTHLPHRDETGTVVGVIVFGIDITDQRQAEQALLQNEKLAAVGRLSASIAHEINNPLESVTNLLYLIRTSGDVAEIQGYVETAERELRRVSRIASQTLRFHRQATKPVMAYCFDLIGETLAMYQGRLLNNGIAVSTRKRAQQPVECLDGEIRQVLSNLIVNAIDAMPFGGRLLLRSREMTMPDGGGRGLVLTVADTGAGMPAAVQQRVFDAFYTTKGIGGTGLGLWISREIVERHGGRLRFRSRSAEGKRGTVFTLVLPCRSQLKG